ncbi:hypothetical protein [uncultured Sulfitobacter sp.]|uniref:hypothetical protein n=1 Tax=uncultured Sulfitobacter sp. TaxID=191468 RepID=UPI0026062D21|nr:hypothetical protein [uncultured Sulfitobacter sp.]
MTQAQKIPTHDSTEAELDADSLSAIRSILTEDTPVVPAPKADQAAPASSKLPRAVAGLRRKADALPPLEDPIADPEAEAYAAQVLAPKRVKRGFSLRRKPKAPKAEAPAAAQPLAAKQKAPSGEAQGAGGFIANLTDRLRGYRPTPAHIALGAFALLVLMRPWLVLGLTFIFLFIMVGVFLILGYDGFWQGMMKVGRWYANRRPARAAVLHARLDAFAMRWDAVLDRFPEGTVDAFYLPDFGDLATAERRHDDALERRLAGMHEKGA